MILMDLLFSTVFYSYKQMILVWIILKIISLDLHSALSAETGIRLVTLVVLDLLPSPILELLE